jgi:crotonobetainyl-CoA:carnitine CoA-transferase CaiB-like acyl-CoA transferase
MAVEGVLAGIRVIDAGTVLAAPGVSSLLADFGAEVIKIEQPGIGDPLRGYMPQVEGQGLASKVTNRGKYSATLNLRTPEGQRILKSLAGMSDVVVVNYRPSTLEGWGLGYEALSAENKALVMLHLTGYGRTGPFADRPGFARAVEAYVGLTDMTGYADRAPVPAGYAVADAMGAIFGAYSVMLALHERHKSGEGQLVDLALAEALMRVMDGVYVGYDQTGTQPERAGTINPNIAPHDIYPTHDGTFVSLPTSTQNMFVRLCGLLEIPEALEDPRFETNLDRVRHRGELDELIRPRIFNMDGADLLTRADEFGVAASRINRVSDLLEDEHVRERESLIRVRDDNLGRDILMQNVVPRLSRTPGEIRWPGHEAGQDNDFVYRGLLGITQDELDELIAQGVI